MHLDLCLSCTTDAHRRRKSSLSSQSKSLNKSKSLDKKGASKKKADSNKLEDATTEATP
jgi:hypothetical protein